MGQMREGLVRRAICLQLNSSASLGPPPVCVAMPSDGMAGPFIPPQFPEFRALQTLFLGQNLPSKRDAASVKTGSEPPLAARTMNGRIGP